MAADGNSGQGNRGREEAFALAQRVGAGDEDDGGDGIHDQNAVAIDRHDVRDDEEKENGTEQREVPPFFPGLYPFHVRSRADLVTAARHQFAAGEDVILERPLQGGPFGAGFEI